MQRYFRLAIVFCGLVISLAGLAETQIDTGKVDRLIESFMDHYKTPGMAVGIISKDGPTYLKGYGVRNIETKEPVTPETLFAIASTTKAMTAAGVAMLVDQELMDWDVPIKDTYFPEFELMDPVATQLVTTRDLLTHRTGLPRHDFAWYGTPFTKDELLANLKYLQPTASIREKYQYNNWMYMVAGEVTERVSGVEWHEYMKRRLFDPLGMSRTVTKAAEMAESENHSSPHRLLDGNLSVIPIRNLDHMAPAGSVASSVRDMSNWVQMLLRQGEFNGKQLLSAPAMNSLFDRQMIKGFSLASLFEEFEKDDYALGWSDVYYRGHHLNDHTGGIDGFITYVAILPEQELGIVLFDNLGTLSPVFAGYGLLDILLEESELPWLERSKELSEQEERTPDFARTPISLNPQEYVGTYEHPAYGKVFVSQSTGVGDLFVEHYLLSQDISHYKDHSFYITYDQDRLLGGTPPFQFSVNTQGKVETLSYPLEPLADPIVFEKVAEDPQKPSWGWSNLWPDFFNPMMNSDHMLGRQKAPL